MITGAETDVCVLATVLGAVDYGYRVVLVTDAVCSHSDTGHDALRGEAFRELLRGVGPELRQEKGVARARGRHTVLHAVQ